MLVDPAFWTVSLVRDRRRPRSLGPVPLDEGHSIKHPKSSVKLSENEEMIRSQSHRRIGPPKNAFVAMALLLIPSPTPLYVADMPNSRRNWDVPAQPAG